MSRLWRVEVAEGEVIAASTLVRYRISYFIDNHPAHAAFILLPPGIRVELLAGIIEGLWKEALGAAR